MSGEQDPSRGREQGQIPRVSFEVKNLDGIEQLTWEDMERQPIGHLTILPEPLRQLDITIDGSDSANGKYCLRTRLEFGPTENGDSRAYEFLGQYYAKTSGEDIPGNEGMLITDDKGYQYLLYPDDKYTSYILETAGKTPNRQSSIESRVIRSLKHGKSDDFAQAYQSFEAVNQDLLTELYKFYQTPGVDLRIPVAAPEEPEEDAPAEASTVVSEKPKLRFEDLGGMEQIQEQLREVVMSIRHPEVLESYGLEAPRGIFLYGPPGTGKTTLGEAIANEISAELRVVKSSDIYGMWMGQSEARFQKIMNDARAVTVPTVLLFDEVDGIIRPNSGSAYATVAALFKQEIGRICQENKNLIVIATSNKQPNEIDDALFRAGRFDAHIYVPLPDERARVDILTTIGFRYNDRSKHELFDMLSLNLLELSRMTEEFSGADITEILRRAVTAKAIYEIRTGKTPDPFTQAELTAAITAFRHQKA